MDVLDAADTKTLASQIEKTAIEFGCQRVTMVGDRGMIKSGQIEDLNEAGFNFITAITKAQIRSMIKKDVLQLGLFDEKVCEVEHAGLRYILRRNPVRADEMSASRWARISEVQALAAAQNQYLADHPRADQHAAIKRVWDKEGRLNVGRFLHITAQNRRISVEVDEEYVAEVAELDGCYCLKTDLPGEAAAATMIHDRYKDLGLVESGFKTCKTDHLELRPIYVRKESRTRGHVFVVMLAYLLRRRLECAWRDFDMTVAEGLKRLTTLCVIENEIAGQSGFLSIPAPRKSLACLFDALKIIPPTTLPVRKTNVDTKQKLQARRK